MLIAIIDDGINSQEHPEIPLYSDYIVENTGAIRQRNVHEPVLTSHGTTCAQVIHNYAPNASFCSIAIFQHANSNASLSQLISALELCLKLNVELIHMSIGTVRVSDYPSIRDRIAKILQNGQIIVAAQSNKPGRYTMPACFSGVFGVASDATLRGSKFRIDNTTYPDNVQIFASSQHILPFFDTQISNSFAAPTITAKLFQLLESMDQPKFSSQTLFRQLTNGDTQSSLARIRPDFLLDAIVYDPDGVLSPELSDCYIFKILKKPSTTNGFFRALEEYPTAPVLIATSSTYISKIFFDKLFYYSKLRVGIVYTGTLAAQIRAESPCLFWDESTCRFARINVAHSLQHIPLLMVNPFGICALKLICRLEQLFIENGYSAVTISNYPRSYLFGFIYFAQKNLDEIITHIQQTMEPDIFICTVSEGLTTDANKIDKIDIELSNVSSLQVTPDKVTLPISPSESQILELFNFLITE